MNQESIRLFRTFKIIQLAVLIIFFIAFFIYLKTDPVLSNNIFTNSKLLTVCVFLWAFMLFSFISLVVDFRHLEKNIIVSDDLNRIAYRDTLTGIPNRVSCDLIFHKYEGKSDISDLAAALISITNLSLINEALGRVKGDLLIQDFASLFNSVGSKYGFVGRNGGNEFLIVIEKCDEEKMKKFLDDLAKSVKDYNESSDRMPVTYKSNTVFNNELKKTAFSELITQLYKERG